MAICDKKRLKQVVIVVVVVMFSFIDSHPYERMRNLSITLLFKHRAIYKLNTKNAAFFVYIFEIFRSSILQNQLNYTFACELLLIECF